MKPVKQSSKKNKSRKSKLTETVCWHENKVWESEVKKTLNTTTTHFLMNRSKKIQVF